jgi:hypothetical protein
MTIQSFLGGVQIEDANGNPVSGAKLCYYVQGTTTPLNVYSDRLGANPTVNPVICDGNGFAPMHFLPETPYDVLVKDGGDSLSRAYYNLGNPGGTIANGALVIEYVIDGGGAPIATGQKGHIQVPYAGALNSWTLLADQPANVTLDIWKDTLANFPPTALGSIVAAAPPTLTAAQSSQSSSLTGWSRTFNAGDILAFVVTANDSAQRLTLSLIGTRS